MTSDVVKNKIIKLAVLKNPYIDTKVVSVSLLEVTETEKQAKFSKIQKCDIEIQPLDLEDDLRRCRK